MAFARTMGGIIFTKLAVSDGNRRGICRPENRNLRQYGVILSMGNPLW